MPDQQEQAYGYLMEQVERTQARYDELWSAANALANAVRRCESYHHGVSVRKRCDDLRAILDGRSAR